VKQIPRVLIIDKIVQENISSALIFEGDADRGIRFKPQMQTFAQASKILVQPLRGKTDLFLDPTYPASQPSDASQEFPLSYRVIRKPTTSPYGDLNRWDVLWMGHCGSQFPAQQEDHGNAPLTRIVISDDETVPPPLRLDPGWGRDEYIVGYPPYTRIVSRTRSSVCTLGCAIPQQGARKFLYEISLKNLTTSYHLALRKVCDGVDGRPLAMCLVVQPPMISSF
jgi:hypothetical protein